MLCSSLVARIIDVVDRHEIYAFTTCHLLSESELRSIRACGRIGSPNLQHTCEELLSTRDVSWVKGRSAATPKSVSLPFWLRSSCRNPTMCATASAAPSPTPSHIASVRLVSLCSRVVGIPVSRDYVHDLKYWLSCFCSPLRRKPAWKTLLWRLLCIQSASWRMQDASCGKAAGTRMPKRALKFRKSLRSSQVHTRSKNKERCASRSRVVGCVLDGLKCGNVYASGGGMTWFTSPNTSSYTTGGWGTRCGRVVGKEDFVELPCMQAARSTVSRR